MSDDHFGVKVNGVLYVRLEDARKLREGWDKADERIAELEAALGHATEYVGRLALTLAGKHYPDQKRFELLPDLLGRIDQIDNMTCGLARAALEGGKDE